MDRGDPTASQETLISLRQLDPSPIEFPEYDKNALPESLPLPALGCTSLGLGGGGSNAIYYLTRLQKYSSYAFTVFAGLHLTNTALIPLITQSVQSSETYLLLTRPYYQSLPLEPLLITLPVALHVTSGIALRLHRRAMNITRYDAADLPRSICRKKNFKVMPPLSWCSLTGYILAPLMMGHAFVNRILPWIYEGGSSSVGLGYVAHGFAKNPILMTATYVTLIGVAASHFVWGISKWNGWTSGGNTENSRRRWLTINGYAAALAAVWMAGGLGVVAQGGRAVGWIGSGYDVLLRHLWL